jgi:hypothetical protein
VLFRESIDDAIFSLEIIEKISYSICEGDPCCHQSLKGGFHTRYVVCTVWFEDLEVCRAIEL